MKKLYFSIQELLAGSIALYFIYVRMDILSICFALLERFSRVPVKACAFAKNSCSFCNFICLKCSNTGFSLTESVFVSFKFAIRLLILWPMTNLVNKQVCVKKHKKLKEKVKANGGENREDFCKKSESWEFCQRTHGLIICSTWFDFFRQLVL